ncbi:MAG TPA: 3'-5' exonuclease [Herbaspirillum sp.]|nr:3'-5' exonuclease [Herbaspirillum sp.]
MSLPQPLKHDAAFDATHAAGLTPYNGISLSGIHLIVSAQQAEQALAALLCADVLGFDTESKPTFVKGEQSRGPHLIQLATDDAAYLFQVGSAFNQQVAHAVLSSAQILKVGFGLSDDLKRLQGKMGISTQNVLDLSVALRQGGRNDVGAKTAVAKFFGMHLQKSKKTSTTNWAAPQLTERQMLYAADDAQVALRIYRAWRTRQHTLAQD